MFEVVSRRILRFEQFGVIEEPDGFRAALKGVQVIAEATHIRFQKHVDTVPLHQNGTFCALDLRAFRQHEVRFALCQIEPVDFFRRSFRK